MTKINLIEKRKKYITQRMNKLKEMEASLNTQERKKRTRHLIERGGLIAKAGLNDWSSNSLLGALLSLKEQGSDTTKMDAWTYRGGAAFSEEKNKNLPSRQRAPVTVKFETKSDEDVRTALKTRPQMELSEE